jgi:hypothetical protein
MVFVMICVSVRLDGFVSGPHAAGNRLDAPAGQLDSPPDDFQRERKHLDRTDGGEDGQRHRPLGARAGMGAVPHDPRAADADTGAHHASLSISSVAITSARVTDPTRLGVAPRYAKGIAHEDAE